MRVLSETGCDARVYKYEIESIVKAFCPAEKLIFGDADADADSCGTRLFVRRDPQRVSLCLTGESFEKTETEAAGETPRAAERALCRCLFRLLSAYTGRYLPWGTLTGVRPVKLVRRLRESGLSREDIREKLAADFLTSAEKTDLCLAADAMQEPVLAGTTLHDCSLYVAIPFCPSRCSYCSFVSHSVEKSRALIPDYLEKLVLDLEATAEVMRAAGLRLRSVYVGGGTPTVLEERQLAGLLEAICSRFDAAGCGEFTVEAGRPDTITRGKLALLREYGVTRISINPQTLEDRILQNIGRGHTVRQFYTAFESAKEFDFTAINVDLIAGLEGDDGTAFRHSLDGVLALRPENITVHTLTMKRASFLVMQKKVCPQDGISVADMVDYSQKAVAAAGYRPYYLYRQKGTWDGLENTGVCLGKTPCLYNIYIMDESHTILSAGAGGVTKIVGADNNITRCFNYKYPYEYIGRFQNILMNKEKIAEACRNILPIKNKEES